MHPGGQVVILIDHVTEGDAKHLAYPQGLIPAVVRQGPVGPLPGDQHPPHHAGRLQAEITNLGRIPLLIVDEVAYIPFEAEAVNVFFQLVSARYERASLIVTSNRPFGKAHMFV